MNAGVQHGRDAAIANMRSLAEIEANITSTVIATRGVRLLLARNCSSNRDLRHGEFGAEMLVIIEIDADNRIAGAVMFDPDDIDAAFAELDARYLAGEAAAHAHTWSVVAGVYSAFNRHELPATTPDWVSIDHRSLLTIEPGDMAAFIRAVVDQLPNLDIRMEAVHRLTEVGAVVTHAAHGISPEGLDAEWRILFIFIVEGDLISRFEMFDETELEAALARFDDLSRPAT